MNLEDFGEFLSFLGIFGNLRFLGIFVGILGNFVNFRHKSDFCLKNAFAMQIKVRKLRVHGVLPYFFSG
jgi:hypothetical protein